MRYLILFFFLIISHYTYSQEPDFKILLGKNESYVRNYFNAVVKANKASGVYLEERKNKYGQTSMGIYSEQDEDLLGCLVIHCFFQKVGDDQVCIRQLIGGSPEYGEKYKVILFKDFKQLSKNKWSRPFNMGFTVLSEYVLEKENYYITYNLID